jgi:hypothetical protein
MDIEHLGFFLFMEEQEKKKQVNTNNRSEDLNLIWGQEEPHKTEKDI